MQTLDEHTLRRLIEVGRALTSDLDLDVVLRRVIHTARELTGAGSAALGILDEPGQGSERLIAVGDASPRPSDGALRVPIIVRGETFGNLYLAEKEGGEDFEAGDRQAADVLAEWAAVAIQNARLYTRVERRREQLERAVSGLEATTAVSRALGGEIELDRVIELVAAHARTLVDARALVVLVADDGALRAAAAAGDVDPAAAGARVPLDSAPGKVLRSRRSTRLRASFGELGVDAQAALLVPLAFRGQGHGVLCAFDRTKRGPEFDAEDQQELESFAAAAATAVATARSVERELLRQSMEVQEAERGRWARELHDQTLQGLSAVALLLSGALGSGAAERVREAAREAISVLGGEIESLRAIIADLRPAALDELGAGPAIEALAERVTATTGLQVETAIELHQGSGRHRPDVESALYRLVQEGLSNAAKHARAERVRVEVRDRAGALEVAVADDGAGFDPAGVSRGFGLVGMRERVALAGGRLEIDSAPGEGTTLRATLPAAR